MLRKQVVGYAINKAMNNRQTEKSTTQMLLKAKQKEILIKQLQTKSNSIDNKSKNITKEVSILKLQI